MIKKEDYTKALEIVNTYKDEQDSIFRNKTIKLIKNDLIEFFKTNLVGGCTIKKFNLRYQTYSHSDMTFVSIIPINPYWDEDYWDEDADEKIREIGDKYNVSLSWESGVYPK